MIICNRDKSICLFTEQLNKIVESVLEQVMSVTCLVFAPKRDNDTNWIQFYDGQGYEVFFDWIHSWMWPYLDALQNTRALRVAPKHTVKLAYCKCSI